MTIKTSSYRQSLLAALLDPVEASAYLNAALEDSPEAFLKALKNVALSEQGNPTFETLSSVLGALGMKLSIAPNDSEAALSLTGAAR